MRGLTARRLPGARTRTAASTAAAAREAAAAGIPGRASIAAPAAAEPYGLRILAAGFGRGAGAVARCVSVVLRRRHLACSPRERTSLLLDLGDGGPALPHDVLKTFRVRAVARSWIQSWPTGQGLCRYHVSWTSTRTSATTGCGSPRRMHEVPAAEARSPGSCPRWPAAS
ncbi:prephenate dehydratase domain-containing protein [Streptomyces sp. NPDC001492]